MLFKKGRIPWNKGTKGLIKPNAGSIKKGQKFSKGTKKKMKKAHTGSKNHFYGKHHSEEVKIKMRERRKGKMTGENHHSWKGGITKIYKLVRGMPEYKQWRSDIFQRDNWTCRTCGITPKYVTAHHIKSFVILLRENNIKTINQARKCEELWDIENGITLCEECHSLTDNYKGRAIKKIT